MSLKRRLDPTSILSDLEAFVRSDEPESRVLLDMIHSMLKMMRDQPDRGDLKMLNQALKELRYAFKVFSPYRDVRKVSVFGSARTPPTAPEFEQATSFANRMAEGGWMVITGAGPGIMEAAQGGAGRARSFGVNIRLPFEQRANRVIDNDSKLVNFKYFFTRKLIFVKETDAIALFPGGFGTHDELFESLTLVQTGKSQPLPIVLIDCCGGSYWKDWEEYIQGHLRERKLVDEQDPSLFEVTEDLDRAVEIIQSFYRNYHSLRFVNDHLIMRLQHPISDEFLDELNCDFSDIVCAGKIERSEVLPEEENEPETHALHRIGLRFNRRGYARLRQLIDRLNEKG